MSSSVPDIRMGLLAVEISKDEGEDEGTATHSLYYPFADISRGRAGRILIAT